MKVVSKNFNENVVELTTEELISLEKEIKFQEFKKTRMPEIEEYKARVVEYIENSTDTQYADYYENDKYLGYEDTLRYIMDLAEWVGGFEQLLELTKRLIDEYGFKQVTFSILVVVIRDELEGMY